jgi:hypothetical protein
MPDHEDSLGGETFSGEEQQDPAEKMTDFGLAKQQNTDHRQNAVGDIVGSIDYMPLPHYKTVGESSMDAAMDSGLERNAI